MPETRTAMIQLPADTDLDEIREDYDVSLTVVEDGRCSVTGPVESVADLAYSYPVR